MWRLTVLSSKYIVLDKKSIPMVAWKQKQKLPLFVYRMVHQQDYNMILSVLLSPWCNYYKLYTNFQASNDIKLQRNKLQRAELWKTWVRTVWVCLQLDFSQYIGKCFGDLHKFEK